MTQGAIAALLLLLAASPVTPQARDDGASQRAGLRALQEGRIYEAVALLQQAVAEQPEDPDLRLLLGQANLAAGLWVPAKREFEAVLRAQPSHGLAAFLLGFSLHHAGRHHEAAAALTNAARLAPENPHPRIYHGLSLLRLGRPTEAQRELAAALDLAPNDPTAMTGLAELKLAEGDADDAEAILRNVLSSEPTLEAEVLLARALLASGRTGEAVEHLQELDAEAPNRSDILYLLSQALLRDGDDAGGRNALQRFQTQKAREERIRLLEVTVSTDPSEGEARLELARLLLEIGQPETAAHHLAPLVRDAPADPQIAALAQAIDRALER